MSYHQKIQQLADLRNRGKYLGNQTQNKFFADDFFQYNLVHDNKYFKALNDYLQCASLIIDSEKLAADQKGQKRVQQFCYQPFERMKTSALNGDLRYPRINFESFMAENVLEKNQSWTSF